MDYFYYLFAVCGFLAVVLALEGGFMIWNTYRSPEAQRIEKRLRTVSAGGEHSQETALLKQRAMSDLPVIHRILMQIPRLRLLDRLLQQAGSEMTVAMFLSLLALMLMIGLLLPSLLGLPGVGTLVVAAVAFGLPWLQLFSARARRLRRFGYQLPEALDLIARAMRAGHSFPSGLEMVASEARPPISQELRMTADEINFGISVQEALVNLAHRVPSTDLSYFVVAVLIQRETGGNLAELLDKLAGLIRQRYRLLEKVRALSAEGRISAWILCVMPFAVAFLLYLINPRFLALLWEDGFGIKLLIGALVLMALGTFWMWRIIRIRI